MDALYWVWIWVSPETVDRQAEHYRQLAELLHEGGLKELERQADVVENEAWLDSNGNVYAQGLRGCGADLRALGDEAAARCELATDYARYIREFRREIYSEAIVLAATGAALALVPGLAVLMAPRFATTLLQRGYAALRRYAGAIELTGVRAGTQVAGRQGAWKLGKEALDEGGEEFLVDLTRQSLANLDGDQQGYDPKSGAKAALSGPLAMPTATATNNLLDSAGRRLRADPERPGLAEKTLQGAVGSAVGSPPGGILAEAVVEGDPSIAVDGDRWSQAVSPQNLLQAGLIGGVHPGVIQGTSHIGDKWGWDWKSGGGDPPPNNENPARPELGQSGASASANSGTPGPSSAGGSGNLGGQSNVGAGGNTGAPTANAGGTGEAPAGQAGAGTQQGAGPGAGGLGDGESGNPGANETQVGPGDTGHTGDIANPHSSSDENDTGTGLSRPPITGNAGGDASPDSPVRPGTSHPNSQANGQSQQQDQQNSNALVDDSSAFQDDDGAGDSAVNDERTSGQTEQTGAPTDASGSAPDAQARTDDTRIDGEASRVQDGGADGQLGQAQQTGQTGQAGENQAGAPAEGSGNGTYVGNSVGAGAVAAAAHTVVGQQPASGADAKRSDRAREPTDQEADEAAAVPEVVGAAAATKADHESDAVDTDPEAVADTEQGGSEQAEPASGAEAAGGRPDSERVLDRGQHPNGKPRKSDRSRRGRREMQPGPAPDGPTRNGAVGSPPTAETGRQTTERGQDPEPTAGAPTGTGPPGPVPVGVGAASAMAKPAAAPLPDGSSAEVTRAGQPESQPRHTVVGLPSAPVPVSRHPEPDGAADLGNGNRAGPESGRSGVQPGAESGAPAAGGRPPVPPPIDPPPGDPPPSGQAPDPDDGGEGGNQRNDNDENGPVVEVTLRLQGQPRDLSELVELPEGLRPFRRQLEESLRSWWRQAQDGFAVEVRIRADGSAVALRFDASRGADRRTGVDVYAIDGRRLVRTREAYGPDGLVDNVRVQLQPDAQRLALDDLVGLPEPRAGHTYDRDQLTEFLRPWLDRLAEGEPVVVQAAREPNPLGDFLRIDVAAFPEAGETARDSASFRAEVDPERVPAGLTIELEPGATLSDIEQRVRLPEPYRSRLLEFLRPAGQLAADGQRVEIFVQMPDQAGRLYAHYTAFQGGQRTSGATILEILSGRVSPPDASESYNETTRPGRDLSYRLHIEPGTEFRVQDIAHRLMHVLGARYDPTALSRFVGRSGVLDQVRELVESGAIVELAVLPGSHRDGPVLELRVRGSRDGDEVADSSVSALLPELEREPSAPADQTGRETDPDTGPETGADTGPDTGPAPSDESDPGTSEDGQPESNDASSEQPAEQPAGPTRASRTFMIPASGRLIDNTEHRWRSGARRRLMRWDGVMFPRNLYEFALDQQTNPAPEADPRYVVRGAAEKLASQRHGVFPVSNVAPTPEPRFTVEVSPGVHREVRVTIGEPPLGDVAMTVLWDNESADSVVEVRLSHWISSKRVGQALATAAEVIGTVERVGPVLAAADPTAVQSFVELRATLAQVRWLHQHGGRGAAAESRAVLRELGLIGADIDPSRLLLLSGSDQAMVGAIAGRREGPAGRLGFGGYRIAAHPAVANPSAPPSPNSWVLRMERDPDQDTWSIAARELADPAEYSDLQRDRLRDLAERYGLPRTADGLPLGAGVSPVLPALFGDVRFGDPAVLEQLHHLTEITWPEAVAGAGTGSWVNVFVGPVLRDEEGTAQRLLWWQVQDRNGVEYAAGELMLPQRTDASADPAAIVPTDGASASDVPANGSLAVESAPDSEAAVDAVPVPERSAEASAVEAVADALAGEVWARFAESGTRGWGGNEVTRQANPDGTVDLVTARLKATRPAPVQADLAAERAAAAELGLPVQDDLRALGSDLVPGGVAGLLPHGVDVDPTALAGLVTVVRELIGQGEVVSLEFQRHYPPGTEGSAGGRLRVFLETVSQAGSGHVITLDAGGVPFGAASSESGTRLELPTSWSGWLGQTAAESAGPTATYVVLPPAGRTTRSNRNPARNRPGDPAQAFGRVLHDARFARRTGIRVSSEQVIRQTGDGAAVIVTEYVVNPADARAFRMVVRTGDAQLSEPRLLLRPESRTCEVTLPPGWDPALPQLAALLVGGLAHDNWSAGPNVVGAQLALLHQVIAENQGEAALRGTLDSLDLANNTGLLLALDPNQLPAKVRTVIEQHLARAYGGEQQHTDRGTRFVDLGVHYQGANAGHRLVGVTERSGTEADALPRLRIPGAVAAALRDDRVPEAAGVRHIVAVSRGRTFTLRNYRGGHPYRPVYRVTPDQGEAFTLTVGVHENNEAVPLEPGQALLVISEGPPTEPSPSLRRMYESYPDLAESLADHRQVELLLSPDTPAERVETVLAQVLAALSGDWADGPNTDRALLAELRLLASRDDVPGRRELVTRLRELDLATLGQLADALTDVDGQLLSFVRQESRARSDQTGTGPGPVTFFLAPGSGITGDGSTDSDHGQEENTDGGQDEDPDGGLGRTGDGPDGPTDLPRPSGDAAKPEIDPDPAAPAGARDDTRPAAGPDPTHGTRNSVTRPRTRGSGGSLRHLTRTGHHPGQVSRVDGTGPSARPGSGPRFAARCLAGGPTGSRVPVLVVPNADPNADPGADPNAGPALAEPTLAVPAARMDVNREEGDRNAGVPESRSPDPIVRQSVQHEAEPPPAKPGGSGPPGPPIDRDPPPPDNASPDPAPDPGEDGNDGATDQASDEDGTDNREGNGTFPDDSATRTLAYGPTEVMRHGGPNGVDRVDTVVREKLTETSEHTPELAAMLPSDVDLTALPTFSAAFAQLLGTVNGWIEQGYPVLLVSRREERGLSIELTLLDTGGAPDAIVDGGPREIGGPDANRRISFGSFGHIEYVGGSAGHGPHTTYEFDTENNLVHSEARTEPRDAASVWQDRGPEESAEAHRARLNDRYARQHVRVSGRNHARQSRTDPGAGVYEVDTVLRQVHGELDGTDLTAASEIGNLYAGNALPVNPDGTVLGWELFTDGGIVRMLPVGPGDIDWSSHPGFARALGAFVPHWAAMVERGFEIQVHTRSDPEGLSATFRVVDPATPDADAVVAAELHAAPGSTVEQATVRLHGVPRELEGLRSHLVVAGVGVEAGTGVDVETATETGTETGVEVEVGEAEAAGEAQQDSWFETAPTQPETARQQADLRRRFDAPGERHWHQNTFHRKEGPGGRVDQVSSVLHQRYREATGIVRARARALARALGAPEGSGAPFAGSQLHPIGGIHNLLPSGFSFDERQLEALAWSLEGLAGERSIVVEAVRVPGPDGREQVRVTVTEADGQGTVLLQTSLQGVVRNERSQTGESYLVAHEFSSGPDNQVREQRTPAGRLNRLSMTLRDVFGETPAEARMRARGEEPDGGWPRGWPGGVKLFPDSLQRFVASRFGLAVTDWSAYHGTVEPELLAALRDGHEVQLEWRATRDGLRLSYQVRNRSTGRVEHSRQVTFPATGLGSEPMVVPPAAATAVPQPSVPDQAGLFDPAPGRLGAAFDAFSSPPGDVIPPIGPMRAEVRPSAGNSRRLRRALAEALGDLGVRFGAQLDRVRVVASQDGVVEAVGYPEAGAGAPFRILATVGDVPGDAPARVTMDLERRTMHVTISNRLAAANNGIRVRATVAFAVGMADHFGWTAPPREDALGVSRDPYDVLRLSSRDHGYLAVMRFAAMLLESRVVSGRSRAVTDELLMSVWRDLGVLADQPMSERIIDQLPSEDRSIVRRLAEGRLAGNLGRRTGIYLATRFVPGATMLLPAIVAGVVVGAPAAAVVGMAPLLVHVGMLAYADKRFEASQAEPGRPRDELRTPPLGRLAQALPGLQSPQVPDSSFTPASLREYYKKWSAPGVAGLATSALLSAATPFGAPVLFLLYGGMILIYPVADRWVAGRIGLEEARREAELRARERDRLDRFENALAVHLLHLFQRFQAAAGRLSQFGPASTDRPGHGGPGRIHRRPTAPFEWGPLLRGLGTGWEQTFVNLTTQLGGFVGEMAMQGELQELADALTEFDIREAFRQSDSALAREVSEVLDQLNTLVSDAERLAGIVPAANPETTTTDGQQDGRLPTVPPPPSRDSRPTPVPPKRRFVTYGVVPLIITGVGIGLLASGVVSGAVAVSLLSIASTQVLTLPVVKWIDKRTELRKRDEAKLAVGAQVLDRARLTENVAVFGHLAGLLTHVWTQHERETEAADQAEAARAARSGPDRASWLEPRRLLTGGVSTDQVRASVREAQIANAAAATGETAAQQAERGHRHRMLREIEDQAGELDRLAADLDAADPVQVRALHQAKRALAHAYNRYTRLEDVGGRQTKFPHLDAVDPANGRPISDPLEWLRLEVGQARSRLVRTQLAYPSELDSRVLLDQLVLLRKLERAIDVERRAHDVATETGDGTLLRRVSGELDALITAYDAKLAELGVPGGLSEHAPVREVSAAPADADADTGQDDPDGPDPDDPEPDGPDGPEGPDPDDRPVDGGPSDGAAAPDPEPEQKESSQPTASKKPAEAADRAPRSPAGAPERAGPAVEASEPVPAGRGQSSGGITIIDVINPARPVVGPDHAGPTRQLASVGGSGNAEGSGAGGEDAAGVPSRWAMAVDDQQGSDRSDNGGASEPSEARSRRQPDESDETRGTRDDGSDPPERGRPADRQPDPQPIVKTDVVHTPEHRGASDHARGLPPGTRLGPAPASQDDTPVEVYPDREPRRGDVRAGQYSDPIELVAMAAAAANFDYEFGEVLLVDQDEIAVTRHQVRVEQTPDGPVVRPTGVRITDPISDQVLFDDTGSQLGVPARECSWATLVEKPGLVRRLGGSAPEDSAAGPLDEAVRLAESLTALTGRPTTVRRLPGHPSEQGEVLDGPRLLEQIRRLRKAEQPAFVRLTPPWPLAGGQQPPGFWAEVTAVIDRWVVLYDPVLGARYLSAREFLRHVADPFGGTADNWVVTTETGAAMVTAPETATGQSGAADATVGLPGTELWLPREPEAPGGYIMGGEWRQVLLAEQAVDNDGRIVPFGEATPIRPAADSATHLDVVVRHGQRQYDSMTVWAAAASELDPGLIEQLSDHEYVIVTPDVELVLSSDGTPVAYPTGGTRRTLVSDQVPVDQDGRLPDVQITPRGAAWPVLLSKQLAVEDQREGADERRERNQDWQELKPYLDEERAEAGLPPAPDTPPSGWERAELDRTLWEQAWDKAVQLARVTGKPSAVRKLPGLDAGPGARAALVLELFGELRKMRRPIVVRARQRDLDADEAEFSGPVRPGRDYAVVAVTEDAVVLYSPLHGESEIVPIGSFVEYFYGWADQPGLNSYVTTVPDSGVEAAPPGAPAPPDPDPMSDPDPELGPDSAATLPEDETTEQDDAPEDGEQDDAPEDGEQEPGTDTSEQDRNVEESAAEDDSSDPAPDPAAIDPVPTRQRFAARMLHPRITKVVLATMLALVGSACASGTDSDSAADPGGAAPTSTAVVPAPSTGSGVFQNPINAGADPSLVFHDGNYHLLTTQGDRISIWRSSSLGGLSSAEGVTVWQDSQPSRSQGVWAPALVRHDAGAGPRWYVYYTASDGQDANHRMYVLESTSDDPLGPYVDKGEIADYGTYAIDGEPFVQNGQLYFTWTSPGRGLAEGPQQVYVAKMANPWTTEGPRVALPVDQGGCPEVREGPTVLQHEGRTFLTYSACDTSKPDYQIWGIALADDADPLLPSNWTALPGPMFARNDEAEVFGPGHHSFFRSPDGTEWWIAYHGKTSSELTTGGRTTRAQRIEWNPDGTPNLGRPLPLEAHVPLPSGDPGIGQPAGADPSTEARTDQHTDEAPPPGPAAPEHVPAPRTGPAGPNSGTEPEHGGAVPDDGAKDVQGAGQAPAAGVEPDSAGKTDQDLTQDPAGITTQGGAQHVTGDIVDILVPTRPYAPPADSSTPAAGSEPVAAGETGTAGPGTGRFRATLQRTSAAMLTLGGVLAAILTGGTEVQGSSPSQAEPSRTGTALVTEQSGLPQGPHRAIVPSVVEHRLATDPDPENGPSDGSRPSGPSDSGPDGRPVSEPARTGHGRRRGNGRRGRIPFTGRRGGADGSRASADDRHAGNDAAPALPGPSALPTLASLLPGSTRTEALAQVRAEATTRATELAESAAELARLAQAKQDSSRAAANDLTRHKEEKASESRQTDSVARVRTHRAQAQVQSADAKHQRHQRIAARYERAADDAAAARDACQQLAAAIEAGQADADIAALANAADSRIERFLDSLGRTRASAALLPGTVLQGPPPYLNQLTDRVNRMLADHGIRQHFTPQRLRWILSAEFRQVASDDGLVLPIDGNPRDNATELAQIWIRLRAGELAEVLADPHTPRASEVIDGKIDHGGHGASVLVTQNLARDYGLGTGLLSAMLPDDNWAKFALQTWELGIGRVSGERREEESGRYRDARDSTVLDNRAESVEYEATAAWELRVRTSALDLWSAPEVVDGAAPGDAGTLRVWLSHADTVGPPERTTDLERQGLGKKRGEQLPAHKTIYVNGLEALTERVVDDALELLGSLDRVGYNHIRSLLTRRLPSRLSEATRPGGIGQAIFVDGEPVAYVQVRATVQPDGVRLLSRSSPEQWMERLRVGFAAVSGRQTFNTSGSWSGRMGLKGMDLGETPVDARLQISGGVTNARSDGTSVGRTGIDVGLRRRPTVAFGLRVRYEVTVHHLGSRNERSSTGSGTAMLRMPENDAFWHGFPVEAEAVTRTDDGQVVLRQDPRIGDEQLALPSWFGNGPGQLSSPAQVQLADADPALRGVLEMLSERGLVPPLDQDLRPILAELPPDPLLAASQLTNLERVRQQFPTVAAETWYPEAVTNGIPFGLTVHESGKAPVTRTFLLRLRQSFDKATFLGCGPHATVRLPIGSDNAVRSRGDSRQWPVSGSLLAGEALTAGERAELRYGQSLFGRSFGRAAGSMVNRVSLVEPAGEVAEFGVDGTLEMSELAPSGSWVTLVSVPCATRLEIDSALCRGSTAAGSAADPLGPDVPGVARTGETDPALLDAARIMTVDIGDPAARVVPELPASVAADPAVAGKLADFLHPTQLSTHGGEWRNAGYRTQLTAQPGSPLATNPLANPRSLSASFTGQLSNEVLVAVTPQVTGDIGLMFQQTSVTEGGFVERVVEGTGRDGEASPTLVTETPDSMGRTGNRSWSRTITANGGSESLVVRGVEGLHYVFLGDIESVVQLREGAGKQPVSVPLEDGKVLFAVPEQAMLRLYGQGRRELPLSLVADAVERLRTGRLRLDRQAVAALLGRYRVDRARVGVTGSFVPRKHETLLAEHTDAVLLQLFGTAVGSTPPTDGDPTQLLDAALDPAARRHDQATELTLPRHYEWMVAAAPIDQVTDEHGRTVDLLGQVHGAVQELTPNALQDDPALAEQLAIDLGGDAWREHVENMLDPNGFERSYPVMSSGTRTHQELTVRIRAAFEGPVSSDSAPHSLTKEDAIQIRQRYLLSMQGVNQAHGTSWSGSTESTSTSGTETSFGIGTDRSRDRSAASSEQLTRLQRLAHSDITRVQRDVRLVVEAEIRSLPGADPERGTPIETLARVTQLVPRALTSLAPQPENQPAENRSQQGAVSSSAAIVRPRPIEPAPRLATPELWQPGRRIELPDDFFVEGTLPYLPGAPPTDALFAQVYAGVRRNDLLTRNGARIQRTELVNQLSAAHRNAAFPMLLGPDGYPIARLRAARRGQWVYVTARASVSDLEYLTTPVESAEIGNVNRRQEETLAGMSGNRLNPLSGSFGGGDVGGDGTKATTLSGKLTIGEQSWSHDYVNIKTRKETSEFEKGSVVTVGGVVHYDLSFARGSLAELEAGSVRPTLFSPDAATGYVALTMFYHDLAPNRGLQP